MVSGDVYNQGITAIAAGSFFAIQPPAGVEVIIHNVCHDGDAQLEFYDGTSFIPVDTQTGTGAWMGMFLHCTNSKYYRVKNTSAISVNMSADGVCTLGV